jgi:hypothetical protein
VRRTVVDARGARCEEAADALDGRVVRDAAVRLGPARSDLHELIADDEMSVGPRGSTMGVDAPPDVVAVGLDRVALGQVLLV